MVLDTNMFHCLIGFYERYESGLLYEVGKNLVRHIILSINKEEM